MGEVPVMVALRLFVPENWTRDPVRLERAGVPVEHRAARTKPEIALAEIDRVIAGGVRFGCVLADSPSRAHDNDPRSHDNDRLCLPLASPPHKAAAGSAIFS